MWAFFLIGSLAASALAAPRYADFEYNCTAATCSQGCSSESVARQPFDTQDDFFERVTECVAKNPGSAFHVRAALQLKPIGCPKSNRVYFEFPKEMEDFWSLPEHDHLVLTKLGARYEKVQLNVGFSSSADPCTGKLEDVFPTKQEAKSIKAPHTHLKHSYLVLDAGRALFKPAFKTLETFVVAKHSAVKNHDDKRMYYCKAGCCADSDKCSNSAMRDVNNAFAHTRRGNACAQRYGKVCGLQVSTSLTFNFATEDVYLCDDNVIGLNLNFTSELYGPAVGGEASLALVPDPTGVRGGSIQIGASNGACSSDETPWLTLVHSHDETFVVQSVSETAFSKPFAVLRSNDINLYDAYSMELPFALNSVVPVTTKQHPKFNGV